MPRSFGKILDESLRHIRRDVPDAYARLSALLGAAPVAFEVDEDTGVLEFVGGGHRFASTGDGFRVRVETDTQTLVELVDADLSIIEALRRGRLHLRGRAQEIARFDDALHAFMAGAIRSRGTSRLLEELRWNMSGAEDRV